MKAILLAAGLLLAAMPAKAALDLLDTSKDEQLWLAEVACGKEFWTPRRRLASENMNNVPRLETQWKAFAVGCKLRHAFKRRLTR